MSTNGFSRPFLKWAGGKAKIVPSLMEAIAELESHGARWQLTEEQRYHEPFLGSGAVYFALKSSGWIPASSSSELADLNPVLVNAMKVVKSRNNTKMRRLLSSYRTDYTEEIGRLGFPRGLTGKQRNERFFYRKRARINELIRAILSGKRLSADERVEMAATMVFLNKTCFNGLWRVNAKGEHNVPEGRYHAPNNIYQPDVIRRCSALLKGAALSCRTFQESFNRVNSGDLIYLDPPYLPFTVDEYVFTSYLTSGFDIQDQVDLAHCAAGAVASGARVIASNNDSEEVREIYSRAAEEADISEPTFVTVPIKRTMNCKGQGRVSVNEVLIFMKGDP